MTTKELIDKLQYGKEKSFKRFLLNHISELINTNEEQANQIQILNTEVALLKVHGNCSCKGNRKSKASNNKGK